MTRRNRRPEKDVNLAFDAAVRQGGALAVAGHTVFMRFTCGACKLRQLSPAPNQFHSAAQCMKCRHVTNVRLAGCGIMLMSDRSQTDVR